MEVAVVVHAKAKVPKAVKDRFGTIHLYVHEAPVEGRANRAAIKALAEYLKVSKLQVRLVRGVKSKQKIFRVLL